MPKLKNETFLVIFKQCGKKCELLKLTSQPSLMSAQQPGGRPLHEKSEIVSLPVWPGRLLVPGSFRLSRRLLLPIVKKDQLSEPLVSNVLRCTIGCGGPPRAPLGNLSSFWEADETAAARTIWKNKKSYVIGLQLPKASMHLTFSTTP